MNTNKRIKKLFVTSEFVRALKGEHVLPCHNREFIFFSSKAALADALYTYNFWKKEGQPKRMPKVLEVILRPIKENKK